MSVILTTTLFYKALILPGEFGAGHSEGLRVNVSLNLVVTLTAGILINSLQQLL